MKSVYRNLATEIQSLNAPSVCGQLVCKAQMLCSRHYSADRTPKVRVMEWDACTGIACRRDGLFFTKNVLIIIFGQKMFSFLQFLQSFPLQTISTQKKATHCSDLVIHRILSNFLLLWFESKRILFRDPFDILLYARVWCPSIVHFKGLLTKF